MVFYFVQRGETLYTIAKRYQTTVHAIVAANRLEDPNAICPGQALIIPRPGEVPSPPPGGVVHLVRRGETLFTLAERFGSTVREILMANQIAHPEFVIPGQQLVIPESAEPGEDWPMLGRTPGRTGATVVRLTGVPIAAWRQAPSRALPLLPSAPVTRYERVFLGLSDGFFYSFDQHTGALKWRVPAYAEEGEPPAGQGALITPAIYDGLAYLCRLDGSLAAVDAHSGRQVWQIALGEPLTGAPVAADGIVYCGSRAGDVFAVEAKAGAVVWRERLDGPIAQPVALGDDRVLAVSEAGSLWALEAVSGKRFWRADCPAQSPPVFAELVVIVGGTAYDPDSGQVLWQRTSDGCAPVVRVDQVFYPGALVDLFTGVDRASSKGPAVGVRAQVLAGELQVLVTADDRLVGWDIAAERAHWSVALDVTATGGIAVAPGAIFITGTDGSLVAYRMKAEA